MPATILVVDDNPMVREIVQRMLNAVGYRALPAEDASTALAIFSTEHIDAAILDIDMPGMNGIELCRALHARAAASGGQFFAWMMTGLIRPHLAPEIRAAGAMGVMAKPFSRSELLACFERLPVRGLEPAR